MSERDVGYRFAGVRLRLPDLTTPRGQAAGRDAGGQSSREGSGAVRMSSRGREETKEDGVAGLVRASSLLQVHLAAQRSERWVGANKRSQDLALRHERVRVARAGNAPALTSIPRSFTVRHNTSCMTKGGGGGPASRQIVLY